MTDEEIMNLIERVEATEEQVLRVVDSNLKFLFSSTLKNRLTDDLNDPFTKLLAHLRSKLAKNPDPVPARHIVWGGKVICDMRTWRAWERLGGHDKIDITRLVDKECRVIDVVAVEEYEDGLHCTACRNRLPDLVRDINESMDLFTEAWSAVLSEPVAKDRQT